MDNREFARFQGADRGVWSSATTSFFDVAFMYLAARPKQWVRFMGRDSLFDNAHGLVGQALSRVGAFPVKRDTADRTSIKRAVRMLKRRELVGILPEDTRRGKTDRVPELHSGAAFVAKMGHAPILPMTVRNAERIKHKGQRFHFPKVTIEYGDPMLVGDFDFLPKEDRVDGCTWYAMRECFALSLNVPPEDVDMPALFPGASDFAPCSLSIPSRTIRRPRSSPAARKGRAEKVAKAAAAAKVVRAVEVIRARGPATGCSGRSTWPLASASGEGRLHAGAAHSQPAGGGRSGRSRRRGRRFRGGNPLGRCRGSERSCGRSRSFSAAR